MRRVISVLILLAATAVPAAAQRAELNEIHLHLGGPAGSLISLTYERLLPLSSGVTATLGIGTGYSADPRLVTGDPDLPSPAHYVLFPHTGSLIFGAPRRGMEIGYGGTLLMKAAGDRGTQTEYASLRYIFFPFVGCRVALSEDGNLLYRVRAGLPSPGIYDEESHLLLPPVGISLAVGF